ncbi:MAG: glycosyltransferase family 2 protein [Myxococcota bacterium]
MTAFRPCILIPSFDNPETIRPVVEQVRSHLGEVVVVDDGSGPAGMGAIARLGAEKLAWTVRRDRNGGKGAAVKTGLAEAHRRGFTHALQVDADGQHELDDVPRFVEVARRRPDALVLGAPVFDESAPIGRRLGREITRFWTNVETLGHVIQDPLCGFRVYPIEAALQAGARGNAMDFDPEIAVRLAWRGLPVINVPTRVRYIPREQGGVSHFRMFRDNVCISWMHTRLVLSLLVRPWKAPRPRRLPA